MRGESFGRENQVEDHRGYRRRRGDGCSVDRGKHGGCCVDTGKPSGGRNIGCCTCRNLSSTLDGKTVLGLFYQKIHKVGNLKQFQRHSIITCGVVFSI